MSHSRREVLRRLALWCGTVLLARLRGTLAASVVEGRWRCLTAAEAQALGALAEAILPGSIAAGVARYVDDQLSAAAGQCMLTIKYLRQKPPFLPFYRTSLRAAESAAHRLFSRPVSELTPEQALQVIEKMATDAIPGWTGPPASLFYFVVRSDAVDVRYGTQAGFQRLGVPYMAHIVPPSPWGSA